MIDFWEPITDDDPGRSFLHTHTGGSSPPTFTFDPFDPASHDALALAREEAAGRAEANPGVEVYLDVITFGKIGRETFYVPQPQPDINGPTLIITESAEQTAQLLRGEAIAFFTDQNGHPLSVANASKAATLERFAATLEPDAADTARHYRDQARHYRHREGHQRRGARTPRRARTRTARRRECRPRARRTATARDDGPSGPGEPPPARGRRPVWLYGFGQNHPEIGGQG